MFGHTKAKRNSHVWLQCASRTVLGLVIGTVLLLTVSRQFPPCAPSMILCAGCNALFSFAGYSHHLALTSNPPCVAIRQRASNPREEVDGESSENPDVHMSNGIAFQAHAHPPFPRYDSLPPSGHLFQHSTGSAHSDDLQWLKKVSQCLHVFH